MPAGSTVIERNDNLTDDLMLLLRGLIEAFFVISYSMSAFSIVFYFSIMYQWQQIDDTVFKSNNAGRSSQEAFNVETS